VSWRDEIERLKRLVEEAYKRAIEELEDIVEYFSTWRELIPPRRLYRRLKDVIDDFKAELFDVERRLRRIEREAGEEAKKSIEEVEKLIEERVKEFTRRYEDSIKKLESYVPAEWRSRRPWIAISLMPRKLAMIISREVTGALKTALGELERALEETSTVISSIRLRREDAEVIDELVSAGIFKSRSEAVAFFVKKGIEASREWLEKVRESIRKIKELQEEVKRELEKSSKEEK
jgi:Arc/MetJ-type ribon-helix-helix transcriptional regulator/gas vesicle protein